MSKKLYYAKCQEQYIYVLYFENVINRAIAYAFKNKYIYVLYK